MSLSDCFERSGAAGDLGFLEEVWDSLAAENHKKTSGDLTAGNAAGMDRRG